MKNIILLPVIVCFGIFVLISCTKTADKANEALKVRCEFLKSLKEPLRVVDESTGEIVLIHPPVKTSTSGLNISIR